MAMAADDCSTTQMAEKNLGRETMANCIIRPSKQTLAKNMLQSEYEAARKIALKAGEKTLSYFNQRNFSIRDKGDGLGRVTDADTIVNDYIISELSRSFPEDTFIGEESFHSSQTSTQNGDGGRCWFIDPIDGTEEFIEGYHEWSVMIGLVRDRAPVLGVVYQPVTDELWIAAIDQGAYHYPGDGGQPTQLKCRPIRDPSQATLIHSRSQYSSTAADAAKTMGITHTVQHASIGIKFSKIAEGKADIYINDSGQCHLWDLCAGEVILKEAGGFVGQLDGSPIHYQTAQLRIKPSFVACAGGLITQTLTILSPKEGPESSQ